MNLIADYMGDDHGHCDGLFVVVEQAVDSGAWPRAESALNRFVEAMRRHFAMEEQWLFPAFEQVVGQTQGPTHVMRMEHEQMRMLFAQMEQALQARDAEGFLGEAETLLILMQQHNAKEENILYPMADQMLAPQRESLLTGMQEERG